MPNKLDAQFATLATQAPIDDSWLHEIKYNGYRMFVRIDGGKAKFISRGGLDRTAKFPSLAAALGTLHPAFLVEQLDKTARDVVLDRELSPEAKRHHRATLSRRS